ncbi:hypothetical protein GCM10009128_27770 [Psychrosphaera haliotis]
MLAKISEVRAKANCYLSRLNSLLVVFDLRAQNSQQAPHLI